MRSRIGVMFPLRTVHGVRAACALVTALLGAVPAVASAKASIASLPSTARGPVSALLGSRSTAYRITHLYAHNDAQRLRATFGAAGPTLRSGRARFSLRLTGYG